MLPREKVSSGTHQHRQGGKDRPEEHANGSKGLGVRGPFVQEVARKHLSAPFPFDPYIASLHPPSPPGDSWLPLASAVGCALQEVATEGLLGKCHYSGWASSERGTQKASCGLRGCAEIGARATGSHDPRGVAVFDAREPAVSGASERA